MLESRQVGRGGGGFIPNPSRKPASHNLLIIDRNLGSALNTCIIWYLTYIIVGLDNHQVHVAAGAHVVEDASRNGISKLYR